MAPDTAACRCGHPEREHKWEAAECGHHLCPCNKYDPLDTASVRCIYCGKVGTHRVCDKCFTATTPATPEQLRATITDGWRLACGCLYLQIAGQPPGTPTFITLPVGRTTKSERCREYHSG